MSTPRNLKLGTISGDLELSAGNLQIISGSDSIAQDLKVRMQFFQGECFLDLTAGIPYFQDVLIKNPDANVLQSVFRRALLDTPGVSEVLALDLTLDRTGRRLSVAWRVASDFGELEGSATV